MKKITLSLVAALAIGLTANAQTPDVKIGAKAGVNFANINGSDANGDTRTAFHIGAVAEIFINEKFSIQPELLYSAQGMKFDDIDEYYNDNTFITTSNTYTTKLDYITIPVMAKYYIFQGLNVQAGPQFAFNVAAKSAGEDMKDVIKTFDFGLNFGLGYELPLGLFVDARYNLGLSNVTKKIEGETLKAKNGVFQLSVGYKF
ncbi:MULTISPECIES: porin family protein [Myroides]|uniref:Outer membrane beta-barrel protein n=1 Tax=Myroides albus TaxID=2562892 RepID=A0A6I3LJV4_9FLAO|nr:MULTISPECIES: porin family protein [Myroides]MTG98868.1 outer membrane beta-barrel protein [Myroides albus]MVX37118.1 outer membrane beta-barrel protein [Myroides sp. LoEW2-1]